MRPTGQRTASTVASVDMQNIHNDVFFPIRINTLAILSLGILFVLVALDAGISVFTIGTWDTTQHTQWFLIGTQF